MQAAKNLRNDAWVILEGNAVLKVGDERDEFRNKIGTVNVDIDDRVWQELTVEPQGRVRVEGEVDKD